MNSDDQGSNFGCSTTCTKTSNFKSCTSDDETAILQATTKAQEHFNWFMSAGNSLYTAQNCANNTTPENIDCWNYLVKLSEFRGWNKFIPVDCGTYTNPTIVVPSTAETSGWKVSDLAVLCK